ISIASRHERSANLRADRQSLVYSLAFRTQNAYPKIFYAENRAHLNVRVLKDQISFPLSYAAVQDRPTSFRVGSEPFRGAGCFGRITFPQAGRHTLSRHRTKAPHREMEKACV